MARPNLKYILLACSIMAAATIISERISLSTMQIIQAINELQVASTVNLNKESIAQLAKELKTQDKTPSRPPRAKPGEKVIEGVQDGRYILGNDKATVSIVEFSDFECPFSKKLHNNAFSKIKDSYIKDKKVKYSYRHLALDFHPNAKQAALATECAGKQGKFWEMKDLLYSKVKLDQEIIAGSAKELKLKSKKFDKCMKDPAMVALIESDLKEANGKSIQGTPTVLINGRLVNGARPFETFEKIIVEELNKSNAD